jgi:peptidoglycan-associated lipoprotein
MTSTPHKNPTSSNGTRALTVAVLGACSLWLAGCGSTVKLDDAASNGVAPITNASGSMGNGTGADANSLPSSVIPPVVLGAADASADASKLPRVVYFDYDSNVVKEEFRGVIDSHAKRLMTAKSVKVMIEGHTDDRGGHEYNLALGQRRAEAVQKSLTLLGVNAEQIEAVSFGKERPAVQGTGEEVWAKNRRAEIKDR